MDAYTTILDDIKKCISELNTKKIIIQPNFSERNISPTCIESKHTLTGINDVLEYAQQFQQIDNGNNYICSIFDGGLVQIHYEFQKKSKYKIYLQDACLTYLPAPKKDNMDLLLNEMKTYIRIELTSDKNAHTLIVHPKAHIHIGFYNDFRIGINRIPKFSEFIELILYLNYNNVWRSLFEIEETKFVKEIGEKVKGRIEYTESSCIYDNERSFLSIQY